MSQPTFVGREPRWHRALIWSLLFTLLGAISAGLVPKTGHAREALAAVDFPAFFCAGESVRTRHDPYLTEPLRTCERGVSPNPKRVSWGVTPAPFPGYVLALFTLFSLLPYPFAHALWIGLMIGAVVLTALLLADLVGWPALAVAAFLFPTVTLGSLAYGEPTPLAMAAATCAAVLAAAGRWRACVLTLGVAMIEPHLALPALIAVAIGVPRTRALVLGVFAALTAINLAVSGIGGTLEYLTAVLPLQAQSEVSLIAQDSLTHLLWTLGVPATLALKAGSLSYLACATAGVLVALRLLRRHRRLDHATAVLIPSVAASLGGPFIHEVQISTALPAAIIVAAANDLALPALVAIVALCIGQRQVTTPEILIVTVMAVGGAIALVTRRLRAGMIAALGIALFAGLIHLIPASVGKTGLDADAPIPMGSDPLAGTYWAREILLAKGMYGSALHDTIAKIPEWTALALILASPFMLRRRQTAALRAFHRKLVLHGVDDDLVLLPNTDDADVSPQRETVSELAERKR